MALYVAPLVPGTVGPPGMMPVPGPASPEPASGNYPDIGVEDFFAGVVDRWPPGREDYHWHVLPGPPAVRERLYGQYRELTHRPGLAPVPGQWLHITVAHLMPVTQVSAGQIEQITGLVRQACSGIAPFAVTAGRPEVWRTGIVCPIRPGPPLRHLWQVTTSAADQVTAATCQTRPGVYHPHLALAYGYDHVDDGPLRAWISDSNAADIALPVTRLVLVAQQHDCRQITWRLIEEIPLTHSIA
jgi:2'-5' RNA ligase